MGRFIDKVGKGVIKDIEKWERGKYELTEEEIKETMPKAIAFYNNQPEDMDVYRDKNGCILLIQTPEVIIEKDKQGNIKKDDEGDPIILNGMVDFPSDYGGETHYLLKNCKFRLYNAVQSIGLFATQDVWKQMGNIYDEKAFIKCSTLNLRYKQIGSDAKAKPEAKFLAFLNLSIEDEEDHYESIADVDESDYITFYGATITQVI